jgi:hypothetical protein
MSWIDGFDTPQNLAEMLRIEARWVRERYSDLTARYLEQAADAIDELAALADDVAVLEGEELENAKAKA